MKIGSAQSFGYLNTFLAGGSFGKPKCNFCFFKEKPKCEVVWGQLHWYLQVAADSNEHTAFTMEKVAYGPNVLTHSQVPQPNYAVPLKHWGLKFLRKKETIRGHLWLRRAVE